MLNSGTGELGRFDNGSFQPVSFCPGYARGLTFVGRKAVVGLSKIRRDSAFQGLPLSKSLERFDADARCGLQIIDTDSGDCTDWLRIEGAIEEIFEVSFLPGVVCPAAIGLAGDEIHRAISIES
ncbi:DUF4915 domain-containing protein [Ruegeria arenilitoris]|uniref:DUF4915 domain-containing protein n=1 Tax=Ruegeria arenilitoris TaxID=1173585 RepID=UPI0034649C45